MGRSEARTQFAIIFGVAISESTLTDTGPKKKKTKKDLKQDDDDDEEDEVELGKCTSHQPGDERITHIDQEEKEVEKDDKEVDSKEEKDKYEYLYAENYEPELVKAFDVAHKKVFGSNAKTGLRLAIFLGQDPRDYIEKSEKLYLIYHKPSRVYRDAFKAGEARMVSLANLPTPPAQVTNDIIKLLQDGFEIVPDCEPGWVAISTCTFEY